MFNLTPPISIWGLLNSLLLALSFWGLSLVVTKPIKYKAHPFMSIPIGMAVWIFVGLTLSFFSLWRSETILILRVLTLPIGLFLIAKSWPQIKPASLYFLLPILAWSLKTIIFIHNTPMNVHDDYHAYLPMLFQLKQTGSMQNFGFLFRGPFQYGGQLFLQSGISSVLEFSNILWLEPFTFGLISIGLISSLGTQFQWSKASILFAQMVLAMSPLDIANITAGQSAIVFTLALAYGLAQLDARESSSTYSQNLINGLLLASLASLKLYYFAWGFAFVGLYLIVQFERDDLRKNISLRKIGLGLFACLSSALLLLIPFALISLKNYSTPFFPFMGLGSHVSAQDPSFALKGWDFLKPSPVKLIINFMSEAPNQILFVILIAIYFLPKKSIQWRLNGFHLMFVFALSYFFWTGLLVFKTGIASFRYSHDVSVLFCALTVGVTGNAFNNYAEQKLVYKWLLPILTVILLPWFADQFNFTIKDYFDNYSNRKAESTFIEKALTNHQKSLEEAQSHVPRGSTILALLDTPFLLNFDQNRIFVADNGGTNGYPSAIGLTKNSKEFRKKLLERNVEYIIFSYRDSANFPKTLFKDYLKYSVPDIRTYARFMFHFQERVRSLSRKPYLVFENQQFRVIKLN